MCMCVRVYMCVILAVEANTWTERVCLATLNVGRPQEGRKFALNLKMSAVILKRKNRVLFTNLGLLHKW